jgi:hypothetical protein
VQEKKSKMRKTQNHSPSLQNIYKIKYANRKTIK